MGRASRARPTRLALKLKTIRYSLGLSQDGLIERLGLKNTKGMFRSCISGYERGSREPPTHILLAYARAANVYVDALIDDELNLPIDLPAKRKSKGSKRRSYKVT